MNRVERSNFHSRGSLDSRRRRRRGSRRETERFHGGHSLRTGYIGIIAADIHCKMLDGRQMLFTRSYFSVTISRSIAFIKFKTHPFTVDSLYMFYREMINRLWREPCVWRRERKRDAKKKRNAKRGGKLGAETGRNEEWRVYIYMYTGVEGYGVRWVTTLTTREGKISGRDTRWRFESNLSGVY